MPVLTSIYPYKCTTYQMTKSSKDHIVNEIQRANNIINVIKSRDKLMNIKMLQDNNKLSEQWVMEEERYNQNVYQSCVNYSWDSLFSPRLFFLESTYFLQVEVMTKLMSSEEYKNTEGYISYAESIEKAEQGQRSATGLFESRLRALQGYLEEECKDEVQVFGKSIRRSHLVSFENKSYLSNLYYLSLPFKTLEIE